MGESSQTPNEETVTVEEANLFMQYNEPVVRQQAKQPVIQPVIQPERQRAEDSRQQKVVSKAPQQAQRRVPQQRNNVEQVRRIKEIRVFYSDGTYEILYPEK